MAVHGARGQHRQAGVAGVRGHRIPLVGIAPEVGIVLAQLLELLGRQEAAMLLPEIDALRAQANQGPCLKRPLRAVGRLAGGSETAEAGPSTGGGGAGAGAAAWRLQRRRRRKRQEELSRRDIRMATVLITIVLVFFSCHLPR